MQKIFHKIDLKANKAFTLVEILVTVVIMAIAAAVVAPNMLSASSLGVQAAARMVISDLLYAQNEAIAKQKSVRVVFSDENNDYALSFSDGTAFHVGWKGGDSGSSNYTMDFAEDERFSGVVIKEVVFGEDLEEPLSSIEYDEIGSPSIGGYIDLQDSTGEQVYRISISEFTGRITVEKQ